MSKLIVCFAAASSLAFGGSAFAQAIIPPAKPHPAKTAPATPPPADDAPMAAPATEPAPPAEAAPPAAAPAPAPMAQATPMTPPAAQPMAPAMPAAPAAQAAQATQPAPAMPATPAAPAAQASLAAGISVKDNTGVTIGQVTELKPDASGAQTATIKMGADTFNVAASSLVVQNGAAVINLTQAQLQAQVHKPGA